jgi:hypothetical protein
MVIKKSKKTPIEIKKELKVNLKDLDHIYFWNYEYNIKGN